jgi:hypothetical protein
MPREAIAIAPTGRASRMSVRANEVLSATRVITWDEMERFQAFAFDANGAARNVDLPAEAASAGAYLWILNTAAGAFSLTIRNPAAGTVTTLLQGKAAMVWCDGTTWRAMTGA